MADLIKNFAYCKLAAAVDAVATALPVDGVTVLPSNAELATADFWMTVDEPLASGGHEIVKVVATAGADAGGTNGVGNNGGTTGRYRSVLTVTAVTLTKVSVTLAGPNAYPDEFTLFVKTTADVVLAQASLASMTNGAGNTFTLPAPLALATGTYRFEVVRTAGTAFDLGVTNTSVYPDGVVTAGTGDYFSAGAYVAFTAPFVPLMRLLASPRLTVLRGQEGTAAGAHASGLYLKAALTKAILDRQLAAVRGTRQTATYTTASLAPGAGESGTVVIAAGYRLLDIAASVASRIRLYDSVAHRNSDVVRAVTTSPTSTTGVILDYVAVGADEGLSPLVEGFTADATSTVPIRVENNAAAAAVVTVTLTYVRTE